MSLSDAKLPILCGSILTLYRHAKRQHRALVVSASKGAIHFFNRNLRSFVAWPLPKELLIGNPSSKYNFPKVEKEFAGQ
jgi:hypothetical protein